MGSGNKQHSFVETESVRCDCSVELQERIAALDDEVTASFIAATLREVHREAQHVLVGNDRLKGDDFAAESEREHRICVRILLATDLGRA